MQIRTVACAAVRNFACTMEHTISFIDSATMRTLMWLVALLLVEYGGVFIAIVADFLSGTLKARRDGVPRTSSGYRRSIDKTSRYYVTLLALTVMDSMIVLSALYLKAEIGLGAPAFPLFTTIGAVCMVLIEVKSIMEKSQEKADYVRAFQSLADILSHPSLQKLLHEIRPDNEAIAKDKNT